MLPALACSAHGAKNACSSSKVISDRRRPPQRGGDAPACTLSRNRACNRGTEALETPSSAAVCSRVAPMTAGKRTACALRNAAKLSAHAMASPAFPTNTSSIRRGLAMAQMYHGSSHLESELELAQGARRSGTATRKATELLTLFSTRTAFSTIRRNSTSRPPAIATAR
jgi:hypothetical protein